MRSFVHKGGIQVRIKQLLQWPLSGAGAKLSSMSESLGSWFPWLEKEEWRSEEARDFLPVDEAWPFSGCGCGSHRQREEA